MSRRRALVHAGAVAAARARFGALARRGVLAAALLLAASAASAKEALPEAADPALEARMVRITSELRCLVCQNQTIADSNAALAVDLRREARELLRQGKSDADVIDYMTARYGDFVLYRPPLKATTVLLWFGPFLLLALGAFVLVRRVRRQRDETPAPLSQAEHARAAELLGPGDR
jgi:cytochrome c-type biogenesis protein CcmH